MTLEKKKTYDNLFLSNKAKAKQNVHQLSFMFGVFILTGIPFIHSIIVSHSLLLSCYGPTCSKSILVYDNFVIVSYLP